MRQGSVIFSQFFVVIDFARTAACSSSACCVSSSSAARLDLIEGRWCSMHCVNSMYPFARAFSCTGRCLGGPR